MNCRTYELYNENEYFTKNLSIHPILIYSNKLVDKKKLEFQKQLLEKLNNNIISLEELKDKYNNIIKIEVKLNDNLNEIKYINKLHENEIEKCNEDKLIKLLALQ